MKEKQFLLIFDTTRLSEYDYNNTLYSITGLITRIYHISYDPLLEPREIGK